VALSGMFGTRRTTVADPTWPLMLLLSVYTHVVFAVIRISLWCNIAFSGVGPMVIIGRSPVCPCVLW
jgi:hypothetical protein